LLFHLLRMVTKLSFNEITTFFFHNVSC
ncbi:hypothetical protein HMPREF1018_01929, partial [Bacteroides fragilis]